jgi:hypothetical protein
VRGTRILVSILLDALADGTSEDESLAEYPTLTVADTGCARWSSTCRRRDGGGGARPPPPGHQRMRICTRRWF